MRDERNCAEASFYDTERAADVAPALRPGGLHTTAWALDACGLHTGACLLDVGCGAGATLRFLRGRGYACRGVDVSDSMLAAAASGGAEVQKASASALPFGEGLFDGVLFECSLSAMQDRDGALGEACRVLKPGGFLLLCDLFAPGPGAHVGWPAPGPLDSSLLFLERTGFRLLCRQDFTREMRAFYAQMVFSLGEAEARQAFWGGCAEGFEGKDICYLALVCGRDDR